MRKNHQRLDRPASSISLLAVLAALSLTPAIYAESEQAPKTTPVNVEKIGRVHQVNGKAWATRDASGVRKTELNSDSPLYDGDILITGASSDLIIVLGNKEASILIKQNSLVKIVHTDKKTWLVDLKQGLSLFNVNQKNVRPGFFKVKTNAAVMGVRGTTFFVKSQPGKDVFLCACIGTVTVNDEVVFKSTHHDFHKFIRRGKGKVANRMTETEMGTEHSDAEAGFLIQLLDLPS